jgi:hypothetical protein
MKRKSKWFLVVFAMIFALGITGMTGCGSEDDQTEASATWGDNYAALIESGEARDFSEYDDMKAELDGFREESGAFYVYVMSPTEDGEIVLECEDPDEVPFFITVDGSEEPDDWGVDYGWEIQFSESWNGEPAAARSAWNDSEEEQCWSGFAPVYDSEGNVVCILGVDFPCTEAIADYPEWNRDSDEWNGFEDEIEGDVPQEVQDMMDNVTGLADKYAKILSGE